MGKNEKFTLIVGAGAVALMSLSAASNPAQGYELSIYQSTPLSFWIGLSIALFTGIVGVILFQQRSTQYISAIVAVIGILLFISLPYLRGYYYLGQEDALQHLGWVREIMLFGSYGKDPYPGMHLVAAQLSMITGLNISSMLLLIPPIAYFIFILSLPLLTRYHIGGQHQRLIPISLLLGCLIPTITAVVIPRMQPISTVTAMHITPLLVWVTLSLTESDRSRYIRFLSCLLLLQLALILYHPQYLLVLLIISSVYVLPIIILNIQRHRYFLPVILIPGTIQLYYLATGEFFAGAVTSIILNYGSGGVSTANPSGSGLSQIGGNTVSLFLRAISVQATIGVIAIISGIIAIYKISYQMSRGSSFIEQITSPNGRQTLLLVACIPVAGLGVVYLIVGDLAQVIRYLCFLVGLGTITVSLKLISFQKLVNHRLFAVTVSCLLITGIAISIPATFSSPHLYKPTQHVSNAQMSGYNWTFDTAADKPILAVDTDVDRHYRAIHGNQMYRKWLGSDMNSGGSSRGEGLVGSHFNDRRLVKQSPVDAHSWYLVTTDYSREQQLSLYNGFQFNSTDYRYINNSDDIERIYDNGDLTVHQINN